MYWLQSDAAVEVISQHSDFYALSPGRPKFRPPPVMARSQKNTGSIGSSLHLPHVVLTRPAERRPEFLPMDDAKRLGPNTGLEVVLTGS